MEQREICGSPGYSSLHHMPLQESGGLLGLQKAHGGRLSHGVSCCCSCRHLGEAMCGLAILSKQSLARFTLEKVSPALH